MRLILQFEFLTMFTRFKFIVSMLFIFATNSIAAAADNSNEDRIEYKQVLEVDGGGVRGAFAAGVLNLMHEDLEKVGKKIHEFFKGGMSGTSTGSFIILALAAPRHKIRDEEAANDAHPGWGSGPYNPKEIIDFYEKMSKDVFTCFTTENCYQNCCEFPTGCGAVILNCFWKIFCCGGCCACCYNCDGFCGPRYSNHPLKKALEDRFGDMTLGEALAPVQIVAYDIEQNRPIYFSSSTHPNMLFVDAALASSAAPTFFPGVKVYDGRNNSYHCVDGGLFDNCSSFSAVSFAVSNYQRKFHTRNVSELTRLEDFIVVSVGTGAKLESSRFEKLRRAGKLGWAADGIEVSMTGTTQATHINLGKIFEIAEELTGVQKYFSFQVSLSANEASMDDPSKIELLANKARREDNTDFMREYKRFVREHILVKRQNASVGSPAISTANVREYLESAKPSGFAAVSQ